jgi:hypothetical protein
MNRRRMMCLVAVFLIGGAVELQAAIPRLIGTWTGTGKAVSLDSGYTNVTFTLVVTNQKGYLFRGTLTVGTPAEPFPMRFTAFIDSDLNITAVYRPVGGQAVTVAFSWGKYIAPTAKQPQPGYSGHWVSTINQDSGTMDLRKQ